MKKKTVAIIVAAAIIVSLAIGGTLAWLTDETQEVKNTFTVGNINIGLEETTGADYKMVPGCTIAKDPKVTVVKGSEKCYVFVKLEKSGNFDDFMTYDVADGWTQLDGVNNVYYRIADAQDADQTFDVLKDNQVKVKDEVTKAQLDALTENTYPTLTITAYAIQYMKNNTESFTPAEAWSNVQPATP